ncbi:septation protein SepH [Leekyejoonella antrihumi]|uniref:DUF3071 domain-containing protein n=1 Tax=Leekyejoonella antrihumi TaxID=1660198 RepID=A0A563E3Y5_9MICO|nr:septation protein SepH [Leekyejoonella antrihumi]TWP36942.1 DUF3071 domain-containing protein [Leekyejoonella antrihumi]
MRDLRLVGVHDDGKHLLLTDSEGGEFRVELTAELRRAVREDDRRSGSPAADAPSAATPAPVRTAQPEPESQMRPREVQALLRAGATISEVADRAGWTPEKVERYAAPIQAERDHVAALVQQLPLRGRGATAGSTFDDRISARLVARGVETEQVEWDSWKGESGRWTVVCRFPAGGRQRQATWLFDPTDRTLSATDDEARWLGEDEQTPGPVPVAAGRRRREAPVYDVEAEGGLDDAAEDGPVTVRRAVRGSSAPTQVPGPVESEPAPRGTADDDDPGADDPLDLVSAMRERAGRRRRSRRSSRGTTTVSAVDSDNSDIPDGARPQEHLDVQNAEAPPLGSHPAPEEVAAHETDNSTDPERPAEGDDKTVDGLGHDPVTGTADLFADQSLTAPDPAESDGTERKPAVDKSLGSPRRASKKAPPVDPTEAIASSTPSDATDKPAETGSDPAVDAAVGAPAIEHGHPQPPARQSATRKGRPSVPSWDDIMFGSRSGPSS